MQIEKVDIKGFRNLRSVFLEIPPEGFFVVGKNGQGKTNFLEAIYYLGTMKSLRSGRDRELIGFEEEMFRIECSYREGSDVGKIAVGYDGSRKAVSVNGKRPKRIAEAFGVLKVVIVTPDDVEMIQSYPSRRRRFLDIVLSMTSRSYLHYLSKYQAVLRQRNAFLKDPEGGGGEVVAWDEQLVEYALEVSERRAKFIEDYARYYLDVNEKLAGSKESGIVYRTNPVPVAEVLREGEREKARKIYGEALAKAAKRDRDLGTTTVGPHRDDIMIKLGRRGMRSYGSQGQQRTSVFALRMSEAVYIEEKTGKRPILLMDDVFSQLDRERGDRLMELVHGAYQTVITTPRISDSDHAPGNMGTIIVEGGNLKRRGS